MRFWKTAAGMALAACSAASAETPVRMPQNYGDIILNSLRTAYVPTGSYLIGGRPADPAEWPASVYASMGDSKCTGTVVGEKVLLIAAHCVGNGRNASFPAGGGQYVATCTHHPNYASDSTSDYALCKTVSVIANIQYERVQTDPSVLAVGKEVLLTGYGCVNPGGGGGNDGTYRIGEANITSLHQGNQDIVTRGGAALCYGDSGGPAFFYLDAAKKDRVQISVNSRGNIKDTSYLSSLSGGRFKSWAEGWRTQNGVKICGLDADAKGCRGSGPGPIDPLPGWCKDSLAKLTRCLWAQGSTRREALDDVDGCRRAHADLFACEEIAERDDETNRRMRSQFTQSPSSRPRVLDDE